MVEAETSAESIENVLEERDTILYDPTQKSIFPAFHYTIRKQRKEWQKEHGIEATASYHALLQGYAAPEDNMGGGAGEITLSGRWLVWGTQHVKPVYLSLRVRNRHSYSNRPPSEFSSESDLLWGTANGFNDSGFQIPSFYVHQSLLEEKLTLYYGQFSIDNFVDNHSMRSAKNSFLNQLFSDNPTVIFPSYGAGFLAQYRNEKGWSVTAGGSNMQGTGEGQEVDWAFDSSDLFEALQCSVPFNGVSGKSARFQIMGWNADASTEEGSTNGKGLSLTLEHSGPSDEDGFVFRYAFADHESAIIDSLFFISYGRTIRDYNQLGVGIGQGRSTESSDWQTVFEMYFKMQIFKEMTLTPDLQIISGDGDNNDELSFAAGIRMGITF